MSARPTCTHFPSYHVSQKSQAIQNSPVLQADRELMPELGPTQALEAMYCGDEAATGTISANNQVNDCQELPSLLAHGSNSSHHHS